MLCAVAAMAALGALLVPAASATAGGAPAPSPAGGQEYGGVVSARRRAGRSPRASRCRAP